MSASCITLDGFMAFFCPEFASVGCASAGAIEFVEVGDLADTITIGPLTATAVAGARVVGSLTWTIGANPAASATSFEVMLADSLFATVVSATRSGAKLELTTLATGYASLLDLETSTPSSYTLTAFTGGTTMVETLIAAACRLIGSCFGSFQQLAQYYLAAHLIAGTKAQDVGVQTSAAINAISAGFSITPYGPADAIFANTPYGRQFLALRAMVPRFGFSVISNPGGSGGGCGC